MAIDDKDQNRAIGTSRVRPLSKTKVSVSRKSPRKKKQRLWLNLVAVACTLAIVSASLFWLYGFSLYVVSSNSMAPTLLSTDEERDRLLCWRLAYRYRKPVRWEIAIFDTPKSGENREIMPGFHSGGESGITVKRVVGLENEQLAIAGGDIWLRPIGADDEYRRQVKPDSVQRGMWINVYQEDFSDVSTEEFLYYWENLASRVVAVLPEGALSLPAGSGLRFLPKSRVGARSYKKVAVLPGIPDRYFLSQEVVFDCESCGAPFMVVLNTPKVVGRCPHCRHLNPETAVTYYGFRSGLPEIGEFASGDVPQTDQSHFRANTYQFVADLKVTMEIRLASPLSGLRLELTGEERVASLDLGVGSCRINDRPLDLGKHAVGTGEWTKVEFYVVDGAVRLFLGEDRNKVFDRVIWKGEKPHTNFPGWESGITLNASDGDLEVRDLVIDRDIHYFSGKSQGMFNYLNAMSDEGDIVIPPGHFLPLGDNTTVSLDGRSWGSVTMDLLEGVAIRIWSPEHRADRLHTP